MGVGLSLDEFTRSTKTNRLSIFPPYAMRRYGLLVVSQGRCIWMLCFELTIEPPLCAATAASLSRARVCARARSLS